MYERNNPTCHCPSITFIFYPRRSSKFRRLILSNLYFGIDHSVKWGPGSVVGIATGYGLEGPGIESRWGARFSAPVQTGSGAHPASCTIFTASFPGVKSGRGVTLTPYPLLVPWSRKIRVISLLSPWAVRPVQSLSASVPVQGCTLPFTLVGKLIRVWAECQKNSEFNSRLEEDVYLSNKFFRPALKTVHQPV